MPTTPIVGTRPRSKVFFDLSSGQLHRNHRILERQNFEYVPPGDRPSQDVRSNSADVLNCDLCFAFIAKRIGNEIGEGRFHFVRFDQFGGPLHPPVRPVCS